MLVKFMSKAVRFVSALGLLGASIMPSQADSDVRLLGVPDYEWHAGCFGTACGNLMGYWDRHGLPDFYTGPTGGGLAPLSSGGANRGIRSLWASQAGLDGRPAGQWGHMEDYWVEYSKTGPDPYLAAGREEHAPDCIGDFIGLSQKKWTNMNDECDGNIDAYSFVFWNKKGARRTNFQPVDGNGEPVPDIPSGLQAWTRYRGYDADVFSQLSDFNPTVTSGQGFTFQNLKAEIDAGYPVLIFLQRFTDYSRSLTDPTPMPKANPEIHGMLAYGYAEYPSSGVQWVYYKTSWAVGEYYSSWDESIWQAGMPVRGFLGYRPKPKIRSATRANGEITITWDGPSSQLSNVISGTVTSVHRYQLERATPEAPDTFTPVGSPTTERTITIPECCEEAAFYRIRLLAP
jgi:hypothetical protein